MWTIAAAKAKLAEVVRRAETEPQLLARNGRPAAYVISPRDFARLRRPSFHDFLKRVPLTGVILERQRDDRMRNIEL
jgi:prevent-host-death family protein